LVDLDMGGDEMPELTEERVDEIARQAAREVVKEVKSDEEMLLHTIPEVHGTPGIVIDELKAKTTPCRCFTWNEKSYCYSPGIIGMLDPTQAETYCTSKEYDTIKPGVKERFAKFREAAEEAHKKILG